MCDCVVQPHYCCLSCAFPTWYHVETIFGVAVGPLLLWSSLVSCFRYFSSKDDWDLIVTLLCYFLLHYPSAILSAGQVTSMKVAWLFDYFLQFRFSDNIVNVDPPPPPPMIMYQWLWTSAISLQWYFYKWKTFYNTRYLNFFLSW